MSRRQCFLTVKNIFLPLHSTDMQVKNALISYQLKSNISKSAFRNTVTTNSLGFRSPEPDSAKPMIALVGDSITFGYGVADDETLAANLQKLLPGYDIQNAGVPGYNI